MKGPIFFISLSVLFYCCSGNPKLHKHSSKVESNIGFIENEPGSDLDYSVLNKLLDGKRVVLIGENSHGIGDVYSLKSKLVEYLYTNLGFEVLAMESGISDVYLQYVKLAELNAEELRNSTVYSNFHCEEIMPLFNLIKSSQQLDQPLIYTGFDSQNFMASFDFMQNAFAKYDSIEVKRNFELFYRYYEIPGLMSTADFGGLEALEDSIVAGCSGIRRMLDRYSRDLQQDYRLDENSIAYFHKAVDNMESSVTLEWGVDNPYARRDSIMAENLIWLMEKVYPDKKFIVWAHNAHIDKPCTANTFMKSMGHYIQEKYAEKSYHIGIFCRRGKAYQWWQKAETAFFNNEVDDLENLMIQEEAAIRFIDIQSGLLSPDYQWLNTSVFGWEPENGGRLNFVPAQRFDALICIDSVKAPIYKQP